MNGINAQDFQSLHLAQSAGGPQFHHGSRPDPGQHQEPGNHRRHLAEKDGDHERTHEIAGTHLLHE